MKNLFTITLLVCFYSCKKDSSPKQSDPAYIQFSAEALAYVQLPVNKYFIYKDSASGMLDSVIVTQSELKKVFQPESSVQTLFGPFNLPAHYYQDFSLLLTSFSGTSQKDWLYGVAKSAILSLSGGYYENSDSASLSLLEKSRTTDTPIASAFYYPLDTITISTLQEKPSVIPSIIIEGKNYSNVEMYFNSNRIDSIDANFLRSTYYWAKGIGIIKREIKTSTSIQTYLLVKNGLGFGIVTKSTFPPMFL